MENVLHLLVLLVTSLLAWIALVPIVREKVLEMERAHPVDLTRPIHYNCRPTGCLV